MRRVVPVLAAAAALAGCGSSPGNTIEITATGVGASRAVLVTENGQGSCDGGPLRQLASDDVLSAREVARDLQQPIKGTARFMTGGGRTFTARTVDGTVSWRELHKPLPAELARAELFGLQLGNQLCKG